MFAGASRWVREVALALRKLDIPVLLVDTNFGSITAARMAGLEAICGNVLSDHIQEEQDLAGIGSFCAVTPNDDVNTLAVLEYMHIFSRANVYQLPRRGKSHGRWQSLPQNRRGRLLFAPDLDHQSIEQLFDAGAVVKATPLTDNFTIEDFRERHGAGPILLFAIDSEHRLRIRTEQQALEPVPGDTVIAIMPGPDGPSSHEAQQTSATQG